MTQVTLDECLNPALRAKIKKLVELNLDSESIWDLLDPNLQSYEDSMYDEVEKYVKYVLWLRENNHSLDNAYEKYKSYTQNFNRNFKKDLATRLELEQKRKDQQRIDELSALMKFSRQQKHDSQVDVASEGVNVAPVAKPKEETKIPTINHQEPETIDGNFDEVTEAEDTESDLDFIDLTTNQDSVTSKTLTTKDLLFETMTHVNEVKGDITRLPLEEMGSAKPKEEVMPTLEVAKNENKTDKAWAFYHQLEAKYGKEIEATDISSTTTYKLGSKIRYQNQEYLVSKVESMKDFFGKPEIIITLKNLTTDELIHVNRKQIENQS